MTERARQREAVAAEQARTESRRAQANLALALDAGERQLLRVSSELSGRPGLVGLRRRLLEDALAFYQGLLKEQGDDPEARFAAARALFLNGQILLMLARNDEAAARLTEAHDLLGRLAADAPEDARFDLSIAQVDQERAEIALRVGRTDEAYRLVQAALGRYERRAPAGPAPLGLVRARLRGRVFAAAVLDMAGRSEEAESAKRQVLQAAQEARQRFPDDEVILFQTGAAHHNLANTLSQNRHYTQAVPLYRTAIDCYEQLRRLNPELPMFRRDQATSRSRLASALSYLGQPVESDQEFARADELLAQLAAEFPTIADYRIELAAVRHNRAARHLQAGRPADAESLFRASIRALDEIPAGGAQLPAYARIDRANSWMYLGSALAGQQKFAAADEAFRTAERLFVAEVAGPPRARFLLAAARHNRGSVLRNLKKFADAAEAFRSAAEVSRRLVEEFPRQPTYRRDHANTCTSLAETLAELKRPGEAAAAYREARDHLQALIRDYPDDRDLTAVLARTLALSGDHATAATHDAKLAGGTAGDLYNAGCVLALCSAAAARDTRLAAAERASQAKEYADRAMNRLRDAVQKGYRSAGHYRTDSDLESLRARPDFQKLLTDVEAKAEPKK